MNLVVFNSQNVVFNIFYYKKFPYSQKTYINNQNLAK